MDDFLSDRYHLIIYIDLMALVLLVYCFNQFSLVGITAVLYIVEANFFSNPGFLSPGVVLPIKGLFCETFDGFYRFHHSHSVIFQGGYKFFNGVSNNITLPHF